MHEFRRRYDRLNVLINNAALFPGERKLTPEGLEMTFATNHPGPFLLRNLLLDSLERGVPSRVIDAHSERRAHVFDIDDEHQVVLAA